MIQDDNENVFAKVKEVNDNDDDVDDDNDEDDDETKMSLLR